MPRWFFTVLTLFGLAAIASYLATVPDPLSLVVGKLGEGGLWTWLAVSIVLAAFLAVSRKAGMPPRE